MLVRCARTCHVRCVNPSVLKPITATRVNSLLDRADLISVELPHVQTIFKVLILFKMMLPHIVSNAIVFMINIKIVIVILNKKYQIIHALISF